MNYRIGEGYDVHPFQVGRKLILGGVDIPFSKGLAGHSDADVLLHSICDALFGGAAMGDIGTHFPDDSLIYKDVSSLKLLADTCQIIEGVGFRPVNIDATLVLELPRLADYKYQMRRNIATAVKLDIDCISVKATTSEKLGFIGREEGIAARSVALLIKH